MIICRCLCCRVVGVCRVCRVCRWRCRVHTGHWDGHHLTTSTSTSAPFFDHPTAAPRGDPSLLELLNFAINFTMKWIHNIGRKYLVLAAIMAIERLVAKKGQIWQDAALLGKKTEQNMFFSPLFAIAIVIEVINVKLMLTLRNSIGHTSPASWKLSRTGPVTSQRPDKAAIPATLQFTWILSLVIWVSKQMKCDGSTQNYY